MSDFVSEQWNGFSRRLKESAIYLANGHEDLESKFASAADQFLSSHNPSGYNELLEQMAAGTKLSISWKEEAGDRAPVDPAMLDSPVADADDTDSSKETAYKESSHHEPITKPEETIAEQAEQVRDAES